MTTKLGRGNFLLTNGEVRRIRNSYNEGKYTQTVLAKRFGVSAAQISRIVNNLQRVNA